MQFLFWYIILIHNYHNPIQAYHCFPCPAAMAETVLVSDVQEMCMSNTIFLDKSLRLKVLILTIPI